MNNRAGRRNGRAGNGTAPSPPFVDGAVPDAATAGRDAETGRFRKGWRGGPGNPFCRKLAAHRSAFLEAIGADGVKRLAAKLHEWALAGDMDAARLVLSYAVGKPTEAPNPDTLDIEEWKMLLGSPDESQVLQARKRLHPGLAFAIANGASLLPALALLMSAQLSAPATAPRVRAALVEAGYGSVIDEMDALQRRIADNEERIAREEAEVGYPEAARRAHARRKAVADG
jgi:hypothetical protein